MPDPSTMIAHSLPTRPATPTGRTAARHLEHFGVEATHLVASETYDPSAPGALAPDSQRVDRVVAHADALPGSGLELATDAEHVVFLFSGTPVPAPGDGLVALTRYWRIQRVTRIDGRGEHAIYAALCA